MTEKDKAMELVGKFADIQKYSSMKVVAKNCALIVVEECLHTCVESMIYYWQQVKKEIENL